MTKKIKLKIIGFLNNYIITGIKNDFTYNVKIII